MTEILDQDEAEGGARLVERDEAEGGARPVERDEAGSAPGPSALVGKRTLNIGQFRLTRLQMVNWGTFDGYKDYPIDERGVMLTGPSGSGKSSMMDGHSVVLLPTYDQVFNACEARPIQDASAIEPSYILSSIAL